MIYPYQCQCGTSFDVIKPLSKIDSPEKCPSCGQIGDRVIAAGHFYGEKVEDAYFCPALGTVVRNSSHRKALAKDKGLIEVGNEDTNKWFDSVQRDKQKQNQKFYDEIARDRIILGSH